MIIPFEPIRNEYGIPVYSSIDTDKFGLPNNFGVWQYILLDDDPSPLVVYKCLDKKILPYHHYNRSERFKSLLGFLMGKGNIPDEVFETVMDKLEIIDEKYLWYEISDILSKSGNWNYVNRIPKIMIMLGYSKCFETTKVEFILEKFYKASLKFDYLKSRNLLGDRKYFPGLRYVAFRLLAEHEALFNFPVPLMKTKSKLKPLNALYNLLFDTC